MVAEQSGRLFHLSICWLKRKGAGESDPRNDTGALSQEQNHNFAERFIDSKWIAKKSYLGDFYTFESAKQPHARKGWNTSRCVRDIVSFKRETQLWIHRIENGRISAFLALKRTCRRDRNWFALHPSNLSWIPYYISPRWIDISLLKITSKHLTGCEALLRCQSYRFIVKWTELLNSWWLLQSRKLWSLTLFWVDVEAKSFWSVSAGNKSSFFNYIPL